MKLGRTVALAMSLIGLSASGCGSGGKSGGSDGGGGGNGDGATGTKFGAVLVVTFGEPYYFASAGFHDSPRLIPAGEFTSLEYGIGEPDGCTKNAVGGCQIFDCPTGIAAKSGQGMGPNVGAITITWPPESGSSGGAGPLPPVTMSPASYDLFFWGTTTAVLRFGFSAAGGTIPAFAATELDVPKPFEITRLNGAPVGPDPLVPRTASLSVTFTGGTANAVFVLEQGLPERGNVMAVCRVAASAGGFTFSSSVIGSFQPGFVSLRGSAVSTAMVAAGDHATTLAIAAPLPFRYGVTIE